jgi:hypothetical protein
VGENGPVTRRWWFAALALLVLIGIGGVVTWRRLHPHRADVASAVPRLDHAIAGVVAATGDTAAVTVSGIVPTTACNGGSVYTQTADLYDDPGAEGALIDRIAAALPASMHPSRTTALGGGAASLDADLGDGSKLEVIQLDKGWVVATATSDCRSGSQSLTSPVAAPDPAVAAALSALGTAPTGWHSDRVACASGQIVTVSTASGPMSLDDLPARLAKLPPAGAIVFTSPSDRLSWRVGNVSTVIAAADSGTHVTAQTTTGC